ncbi:hypothetical protein E3N88_34915 [Mikania micrantha]|uniref:Uncharacterized protein n=1 Tax=Mikania micrantha TaxID=192012 RepID=A0A5N6LZI2_9ASTR|nr:hypothetical protein E3N88_34915 [Mikania micrantha]
MLLHSWSFSSRLLQSTDQSIRICYEADRLYSRRRYLKLSTIASLTVGTNVIVEIAHNKPLIAATLCAAAGQLAKPFTASILYQKDFDPKAAISAGGFPSTHSSVTYLSITCFFFLYSGFSDSIFGLAVVYAALTMYDAQGVRREVGVHARTLNKMLTRNQSNTQASCDSNRSIESSSKKLLSSSDSDSNSLMLEKGVNSLTHDMERGSENYGLSGQLKESIGHTEIEVAAGALLGVLTSLAVYSF